MAWIMYAKKYITDENKVDMDLLKILQKHDKITKTKNRKLFHIHTHTYMYIYKTIFCIYIYIYKL